MGSARAWSSLDVEGRLLYSNQQAREAMTRDGPLRACAGSDAPARGARRPPPPVAGRRARARRGHVHSPASKVRPRWRPGKKRLSSRHSTRTTGSSRRRPSTSASAGPPSGAVSRRTGYTKTAGANGRKPRSAVVVHHRSPDPTARHRFTLRDPPPSSSSSIAPCGAVARAIPPSRTTGRPSATGCQSGSAGGCGRKCPPRRWRSRSPACSGGSPTTFASMSRAPVSLAQPRDRALERLGPALVRPPRGR